VLFTFATLFVPPTPGRSINDFIACRVVLGVFIGDDPMFDLEFNSCIVLARFTGGDVIPAFELEFIPEFEFEFITFNVVVGERARGLFCVPSRADIYYHLIFLYVCA
jgi:hypothetical protein